LEHDISEVKNVGGKRARQLNDMGVFSVWDLLSYYPRDYEDRTKITPISDIIPDEINIIKAKPASKGETSNHGRFKVTKVELEDGTGRVTAVWFNQPYMENYFISGRYYIFVGKAAYKYGSMQITPYDHERVTDDLKADGKIIPKYRLPAGFSAKIFKGLVKDALKTYANDIPETLPDHIIKRYNLCPKAQAVINIHFPASNEAFYEARVRLVFEELFQLQLTLFQIRGFVRSKKSGVIFSDADTSGFLKTLPFTLTQGQKNAIDDIVNDLKGEYAMNRLLQGDVGSGKTAVAAAACYICAKNGYQAAVMAPTEILVKQHFGYFSSVFEPFGIKTVLLSGKMKAKEKREALEKTASGEAKIIIGTHAVIQDAVEFHNLALAITDEQHRFGVRQRRVLADKGTRCHMLVMTATPIPRSLALILYGDMDISAIKDKPPGRRSIATYAVTGKYRRRVFAFVKSEIEKGNRAYFICPAIEDNDEYELKSVLNYEKEAARYLEGIPISILHGKMKQDEKDDIMSAFKEGKFSAIIATTVIEVGINVPEATVIVIEDAHRFGLSQLHQLRGRVGRGSDKSYCILITDMRSKIARQRMDAIKQTQSGFTLSRLDLEIRGPGDYFGTRQHGIPEMKIANLYKDTDILKQVQEAIAAMTADEMREAARELQAVGSRPYFEVTL